MPLRLSLCAYASKMVNLAFLYLLVGTSAVYGTRQQRFLFDHDSVGVNTFCQYPKPFSSALTTVDTVLYRLRLQHAVVVQKIVIDTDNCNGDRALIEGNFTLHYEEATDILKQEMLYSDNLFAQWDTYATKMEITLDPVLYADHLALKTVEPVQCSSITVYGCTPDEICPPDTCKNNGICVGNGICSCQKGFMGDRCENSVSAMTYDNYEFIGALPNVVFTKDAAFDVSGDVTFDIQPADVNARTARTFFHNSHHGSFASFFGFGGSCHHSSSHSVGYTSSSHATYGHHSSNSPQSCMSSLHSGYSHTSYVSYGHNHHHGSTHYFYTTHGTSHNSNGASLHYCNNQLQMHVHNGHYQQNNQNGYHYHVVAPFHPKPGQTYSICSTYSPQHGAGIYVNGQQTATQTKPTPIPVQPAPQKPLCFGSCGANTNGGSHNYTLSNLGFPGGCVPFLAKNFLLGLLGTDMLKLLLHSHHSTPSPSQTHAQGFTLAPTQTTTLPPASATTGHGNVVTSTYGPVCFDCLHVNDPKSCTQKMQCYKDDVCLVFKDKYGYTQRCISIQDCQKGLEVSTADCWSCCDANLCNQNCNSSLPVSTTPTSCKDEQQCVSLKKMAAFYDVCADPVYSTTACKKTCGNCP